MVVKYWYEVSKRRLFWQHFCQNWDQNFRQTKNCKTEIYEISRHQKLLILEQKPREKTFFAQKSPILDEFSWIHMKSIDFMGKISKNWANYYEKLRNFFKTEQIFPKLSSKIPKTTIYEISRNWLFLETCQKKPAL